MKKLTIIIITCFLGTLLNVNAQIETAGVVSVYTQNVKISPELAESILRIELTKTQKFNVLDKLDMLETINDQKIDVTNCFGKKCLTSVGKAASIDKIATGSIENLGKKIVVTIKILDVESEEYTKIAVEEFIVLDDEIQNMVKITLNKALGIDNDPEMMNNFVYYNQPPSSPTTFIKNNGPRMGVSYLIGNLGEIVQLPENEGGYDMDIPMFTQIGYQFEQAYLSAGTFQALVEGLIFINGIERNQFNPSFAFLNGFRSSKNGWEFAFGPTLRLSRIAKGYYENDVKSNENWRLNTDWYQDPQSQFIGNPYAQTKRVDSRGNIEPQAGFVFALGKTFHSGYLNIPLNLFYSTSIEKGGYLGLSMGFNIAKKE